MQLKANQRRFSKELYEIAGMVRPDRELIQLFNRLRSLHCPPSSSDLERTFVRVKLHYFFRATAQLHYNTLTELKPHDQESRHPQHRPGRCRFHGRARLVSARRRTHE